MKKYKPKYGISFIIFFIKTGIYGQFFFIKKLLTKHPLLSKNFLEVSLKLRFWEYIKFQFIIDSYFLWTFSSISSLCTVVGFITVSLEIKNVFSISDAVFINMLLIFFFLIIRIGEDSVVKFTGFFTYIFLLFFFFKEFYIFDNPITTYIRLFIFIAVIRPLWNFLVELCFFVLIKKIYQYSWFQKLLPHLSPNFDIKEMEKELKNKKKQ